MRSQVKKKRSVDIATRKNATLKYKRLFMEFDFQESHPRLSQNERVKRYLYYFIHRVFFKKTAISSDLQEELQGLMLNYNGNNQPIIKWISCFMFSQFSFFKNKLADSFLKYSTLIYHVSNCDSFIGKSRPRKR